MHVCMTIIVYTSYFRPVDGSCVAVQTREAQCSQHAVRLADRGNVQGPLAEVADGTRLHSYRNLV